MTRTIGKVRGNRLRRLAAAGCLFAVLLAGGIACAQKAPKGQAENKSQPKDSDSGRRHASSAGEGPVVDNWKMSRRFSTTPGEVVIRDFGSANLTLNSDGSWNFSGQMNKNQVGTGCRFYIVMAAKSSEGTSVAFRVSDILDQSNPQSYSWQKQGNNRTIKDNFAAFKKSHDWAGHWTCVGLPQAGDGGFGDSIWQRVCLGLGSSLSGVACPPAT